MIGPPVQPVQSDAGSARAALICQMCASNDAHVDEIADQLGANAETRRLAFEASAEVFCATRAQWCEVYAEAEALIRCGWRGM